MDKKKRVKYESLLVIIIILFVGDYVSQHVQSQIQEMRIWRSRAYILTVNMAIASASDALSSEEQSFSPIGQEIEKQTVSEDPSEIFLKSTPSKPILSTGEADALIDQLFIYTYERISSAPPVNEP